MPVPKIFNQNTILAEFFAGYLKLTLYLQHPCISIDLGHNKGQKEKNTVGILTASRHMPKMALFGFCAILWPNVAGLEKKW